MLEENGKNKFQFKCLWYWGDILGVINYCVLLLLFLQRYILGSIGKCNISDYKCLLPCNIVCYILDLTLVINAFWRLERIVIKLSAPLLYTCFLSLRLVTCCPGLVKMLLGKISSYLVFSFETFTPGSYRSGNVKHGTSLLSLLSSWVVNCLKQILMWTIYDLSSCDKPRVSLSVIGITEVLPTFRDQFFLFPVFLTFISP